jgi:hypothetical protein
MSIENNDEFEISPVWLAHKDFKKPFKYTIESSNTTVLLQRLDMPDLLKLGIAQEMDFMSKSLMAAPATGDQKPQAAVADAVKLADNFGKMESMIDKVVIRGCLKPKLYPVPEHENARQGGLMYIDQVPWDDRMELFSVIFETQGLSDFRPEQDAGVGDVANVQDVQLPANGPVADVRPSESEGVLLQ